VTSRWENGEILSSESCSAQTDAAEKFLQTIARKNAGLVIMEQQRERGQFYLTAATLSMTL